MKQKRLFPLLLSLLLAVAAPAQKSPEQLGGVYYAYPAVPVPAAAAPPQGYVPCYVSHYGRHGSRWLPSDSRYEWVVAQLADEANLTRRGRSLRRRMLRVWDHARGHGGELTPVGERQQQGLAVRMAARFPLLMQSGARVEARSSVVGRCRRSMEAFCTELGRRCPGIGLTAVTDSADMRWMSYDSPDELLLQRDTRVPLGVSPQRWAAAVFREPARVADAERLFSEVFTIATDMQDVDGLRVSLFDLFTREEMEALYRQNCTRMKWQNGRVPGNHDIPAQCAARLWRHISAEADAALATGRPAATLRFGHDTALYRLLSLLGVADPSEGRGELDRIVPMAANLQMLFCRRAGAAPHAAVGQGNDDVLVGFWLNELPATLTALQPVARQDGVDYYSWTAVKRAARPWLDRQLWKDRTQGINTLVGTDYAVTQAAGRYGKGSEEHGQTLPAVLEPHGHTFWTPQTQDTEQKCVAPYYYRDSLFQGFRASHWLVGGCTQDYGSFTLMPMTGRLRLCPAERATLFSHTGETAHPYYYAANLPAEQLLAEMMARSHSALFRFTPGRSGEMHVAVHPNSDEREGFVAVDTARRCIWGYNPVHRIYQGWGERAGFSGWFVVEFQQPVKAFGVRDTVAYVTLDARAGEPVLVRAASSFVDVDGAWANLRAELPAWDFLGTRLALDSIWQQRLQTLPVEAADEAAASQFYGALYRASFLPHEMSDVDGRRPAFATGRPVSGATAYGDFSMWDIYRAQLPLLSLVAPERMPLMMQSLVQMYREGGWMPIFPCWNSYTAAMIGDHAAAALADSWVRGTRGFDLAGAYAGLRRNAFERPATFAEYKDGMGRRALESYLRYGYIPMEDSVQEAFHTHEQVSRTLEYAYDDFCDAQLAKALGRTADYEALMKRARNWRNVINPHTGWADGRHRNGRWLGNRDLTNRVPFITEGAVIHYSFYVPHDIYGLMEAMGGREKFIQKLDMLFGISSPSSTGEGRDGAGEASDGALSSASGEAFYWHGNEPCHQIPYMYAWAGQPWKTQQLVRRILQTEYLDLPGGLSGNDDAGQMSAWYIFSALGFYPVCPATPYYILGSPTFRRARIGRLVMEAPDASAENIYIQRATWNGRPYTRNYISHDMLAGGGTLRLDMGPRPNKAWGSRPEDCPPDVMQ